MKIAVGGGTGVAGRWTAEALRADGHEGIIGSHGEAEDVVAECWFRLVAADQAEPVRDVEAWAVVAVSRMALDLLRSARVRRERYVGPWLPVRRRVH